MTHIFISQAIRTLSKQKPAGLFGFWVKLDSLSKEVQPAVTLVLATGRLQVTGKTGVGVVVGGEKVLAEDQVSFGFTAAAAAEAAAATFDHRERSIALNGHIGGAGGVALA